MTLNPDFVEIFPRLGFEHVCSVKGIGSEDVSIKLSFPSGNIDTFTFGSNSGTFDSEKNFTRVAVQNGDEMFIISEKSSITGCDVQQEIYFLLNISSAWNGGEVSCGYYDNQMNMEYKFEKNISMIPSK